ncbi:fumarylacetoacetate hydrolase family protein [Streptomyces purpurogeneiscleroticus]|uniref:fumarylacetoacetate hydrolase family protein n=1 Tax=Streptomyces purpurogeneiscleroticus TaxID=68259 RepID=UPI001CBAD34A|nr:fumarylacetoacetate hydrolase family protein [Streptomyces purpurogeneiscleroticus]MBZ4019517.1 2-hydroxyhepta-2,4-diene-1,7-dioate isomerase [Streptomyces purpurogeneiscleroticus]
MRLLRVGPAGHERPCAVDADGMVRDLSKWLNDWTGPLLDPETLSETERRLAREAATLPAVDVRAARIGPPVKAGGHLISIGLNYRAHAAEAGMELPAEPIVASKSPWSMAGPYDDLQLPPGESNTDWEVELAVVIGRRARYLTDDCDPLAYVAGYCTANDVSERRWLLERGGQWVKGKSFDTFTPLGPHLVTPDEVGDPQKLALTCKVNGRTMQDGNTSDMVVPVAELIRYLSQFMTLQPGDVVLTGSTAGVALGRPDTPYLKSGDIVEAEVEGLGAHRQRCVPAQRTTGAPERP